ncbi:MAG: cytochrome c oxidase accessory protein CcoG, partial [Pseudomonadota bacterium]
FEVSAEGLPGLTLSTDSSMEVGPTESRWIAIRVQLPYEGATPGSHPIHFTVKSAPDAAVVTEKSVFIVPR